MSMHPCGGWQKIIGNKVIKLIVFAMNSRGDTDGHREVNMPDMICMRGVL